MGIPILKTPSHITLAIWVRIRVRVTGDAYVTRALGMGMPKTRGCPYHWGVGNGDAQNAEITVSLGLWGWGCTKRGDARITRVFRNGDARITRVLGMGMRKTRGCPYH